jgi:hypothetical protein
MHDGNDGLESMASTSTNATQAKQPWWRFRFSLKLLFAAVTIVCVWLGTVSYKANRQRQAVEMVHALGGRVSYAHQWDYSGRFPKEIKGAQPPGPEWLRSLVGVHYFTDVTFVSVNGPDVDDADIKEFAWLPHLKGIGLLGTAVGDGSLDLLRSARTLRWLYLERTGITDAGLARIRRFPNIESLTLGKTAVTDSGLIHLAALGNLQELDLTDTAVSDAGLSTIGTITSLKQLYLYFTNVTDAGLPHLQGLKNLEELGLSGTRVTKDGVQKLQQALPKAGITYGPL